MTSKSIGDEGSEHYDDGQRDTGGVDGGGSSGGHGDGGAGCRGKSEAFVRPVGEHSSGESDAGVKVRGLDDDG